MYRVLVMRYDKRSKHLHNLLVADGSENHIDFLEPDYCEYKKISDNNYDLIVMPIPTKTIDGSTLLEHNIKLDTIINKWKNAKFIYATINRNSAFDEVNGINLLEEDEFVLKNAYLTAKAVIEIVLSRSKINNKICMIVGNGRIGKYLCSMLRDNGADILLVTKNYHDLQMNSRYRKCIGYNDILSYLNNCDMVFNTAPYNYFTLEELNNYEGTFFELASKPYGFKYDINNIPKSVVMCPSLPGKYYPEEAAKIIYDSIYEFALKG